MVTIVVHRDGDLENKIYKMPVALLRFLKIGGTVTIVLVIVGAILYAPVARTAARVPGLRGEIRRLSEEVDQVRELARTLEELESRYDQVRTALGANVIPEVGTTPNGPIVAHPIHARPARFATFPTGASVPTFWPLDSIYHPGVLTRRQVNASPGVEAHQGIDIAVPQGTPIRAAGGGIVAEAGFDRDYGLFVLIDHPSSFQTMYGHASRLLAAQGDSVDAGQVIALAGNTGRSTAPHLHFEKRRGNQLIDPMTQLSTSNPESL